MRPCRCSPSSSATKRRICSSSVPSELWRSTGMIARLSSSSFRIRICLEPLMNSDISRQIQRFFWYLFSNFLLIQIILWIFSFFNHLTIQISYTFQIFKIIFHNQFYFLSSNHFFSFKISTWFYSIPMVWSRDSSVPFKNTEINWFFPKMVFSIDNWFPTSSDLVN